MKKILIFSVAYYPFVAGAEVAVKEITDRIHECEFDMITLNLDGKQKAQEKIGNIFVYRIGGKHRIHKFLYPFAARWLALKLHRTKNYDALWSIMASFSGFAALFFKYSKKNVRFILTLQEGDSFQHIRKRLGFEFMYILYRQIFKKADTIQAISQYLAQFAKDMGARVEPIVIPNGVDLTTFSETFSDSILDEVCKEIGKEKGERILITTSRLVEKNGVQDIIESLIYLPNSIKLVIIGSGDLDHHLRHIVEKNKLSQRVVFLGQKEHKDLPKYLKVADVFVRPSLSEGMGNSFIEAMAAGIPIIATSVGGIPDFLKDHETGLFCNVHDPKDIAAKVQEILGSPLLAENIKTKALASVKTTYEWHTIAEKMSQLFSV